MHCPYCTDDRGIDCEHTVYIRDMSYATASGGTLFDEVEVFTDQLAEHIDRQAAKGSKAFDYTGIPWAKELKKIIAEMRSMLRTDPPKDPEDARIKALMRDELGRFLIEQILGRQGDTEVVDLDDDDSLPQMSSVEWAVFCADPEELRKTLAEWGGLLEQTTR